MKKDENSYNQPSDEFNQQLAKLLTILKRVVKNNPKINQEEIKKVFGEFKAGKDNVNLNVFFLTFMPFGSEEMDELGNDLEELFDEDWEKEEPEEELRFELSSNDEEFLKKYGIKF